MEPHSPDESTAPSTVTSETAADSLPAETKQAPEKPLREQLTARSKQIAEKRKTDDGKTAPVAEKAEEAEKQAGDVDATDGKAKAKGDEKETVPLHAFKARLGREREKQRALQEQVFAKEKNERRLQAALDLAGEELQRMRSALEQGQPFDAKSEQLRAYEVEKKARELALQLDGEVSQAHADRERQERHESFREQLREEVEGAISAHPMIHRAELVAALKLQANAQRPVADVARELAAVKLEIAKKHLAAQKPISPQTVKAKGGGSHAASHPLNRDGMKARLAELANQNRT